jgi:hypothetical protein
VLFMLKSGPSHQTLNARPILEPCCWNPTPNDRQIDSRRTTMSAGAEFWFKVASFVLVGMLWGCSNAVLTRTTTGAKQQRRRRQASGGVWAGLRALLGTKVWTNE